MNKVQKYIDYIIKTINKNGCIFEINIIYYGTVNNVFQRSIALSFLLNNNEMKNNKFYKKAFGLNHFGMVDFPIKFSNVKISRLKFGDKTGRSWCFPHGFETSNATCLKNKRNWKYNRNKQWRKTF